MGFNLSWNGLLKIQSEEQSSSKASNVAFEPSLDCILSLYVHTCVCTVLPWLRMISGRKGFVVIYNIYRHTLHYNTVIPITNIYIYTEAVWYKQLLVLLAGVISGNIFFFLYFFFFYFIFFFNSVSPFLSSPVHSPKPSTTVTVSHLFYTPAAPPLTLHSKWKLK